MTFLAPSLLFLGLAAAVPLLLHLLQRHQGPRMSFPALRYLRRAEREHATRIRLRQVLLLALRVLALLLLAAAAARPLLRGAGAGHEPTSVAIILDNSLSSGAVVGDARVLDRLRDAALRTLEAADPEDRFWLIRAGVSWEPAVAGGAAAVAEAVRQTEPAGGAADLTAEVARAAGILASEEPGRAREIHLLSDLQATSFHPGPSRPETPPVVVLDLRIEAPRNRGVGVVQVGGGLPPRSGERSTVTAGLIGDAADSVTARLVLGGAVRAAVRVSPGATALLPFPAQGEGLVTGHVEIDADALVADDRRHFVVPVEAPPAVALSGPAAFLDEALDVLVEAGRIRRAAPSAARVVVAPAAAGVDALRAGRSVIVLPPSTPLELAGANQRLATAGVPWRFGMPRAGEARLRAPEGEMGDVLADIRLRQVYDLEPQGEPSDSVLLRIASGEPWAVAGEVAGGGRYVLIATPLTPEGGTIPTSAAMLPLLDRAVGPWAASAAEGLDHRPGDVVTLPAGDSVAGPDTRLASARSGEVYRLERPGIYRVFRDGALVAAFAVNPAPGESDLRRADARSIETLLPGRSVRIARPDAWQEAIYQRRVGREISLPLVLLALLVLLLEAAVAAGGVRARRAPATRGPEDTAPQAAG